jgi:ferredoxin--NADP+ reductase
MLVRSTEELRATDIPEHVVAAFAASTYREVVVVGRRGPAYAKFTNKEFLEFLEVEGCDVVIDPADLELSVEDQAHLDANPQSKRLFATFVKAAQREPRGRDRRVRFLFDRRPTEILAQDGAAVGIRLARTSDPADVIALDAELILRSVGYRGKPIEGLPFDDDSATVPSVDSRVADGQTVLPGVYVAGWIKRGPTGVVGTNRRCALDTVTSLLEDVTAPGFISTSTDAAAVDALLAARGVQVVDWTAWRSIEAAEIAEGATAGRERVKLHDRDRMLHVAGGALQVG